jgi:hypothetical protein
MGVPLAVLCRESPCFSALPSCGVWHKVCTALHNAASVRSMWLFAQILFFL